MTARTVTNVLLLAVCLLRIAFAAPALDASQKQTARALWDTYMDAGATANQRQDSAVARTSFELAVQLAEQMGPDPGRLLLSRMMLMLTCVDMNDMKCRDNLGPLVSRFDVNDIDESLIPVSRTLDRLGNIYWNRYQREENKEKKDRNLAETERCRLLQWAIQRKELSEQNSEQNLERAQMLANYGYVLALQGHLDDAKDKLQKALQYWNTQEGAAQMRKAATERFSLLYHPSANAAEISDDPLGVRLILGDAYMALAGKKSNGIQPDAGSTYKSSEDQYRYLLQAWESVWPQHSDVAMLRYLLAWLYREEKHYSQAELLYRKSIELYEFIQGPKGTDVAFVANEFAEMLETIHREKEAAELRKHYGLRKSP